MRRISFLLMMIAALAAHPAAAQRDTVASPSVTLEGGNAVPLTGRVVDARTGAPLRAAGVKLPAANVGVYTDEQGRFSVRVPPGTYGSVVGVLGYRARAGIWTVAPGDSALLIRLEPDPVVLRGLVVQASRIERRARAMGTSERHWNRDQLVNTSFPSVTDFVFVQAGLSWAPCGSLAVPSMHTPGTTTPPGMLASSAPECVRVRGVPGRPCVILDEAPSSLQQLSAFRPQELYRLEMYGSGGIIVAYTTAFAQQMARHRVALVPLQMLTGLVCGGTR
jgi:hypothetical protein